MKMLRSKKVKITKNKNKLDKLTTKQEKQTNTKNKPK